MTDPPLYLPPGACQYYLAAAWLVHPSTSTPGAWQATRFVDGEVMGHVERPSRDDLLAWLVRWFGADVGKATAPPTVKT